MSSNDQAFVKAFARRHRPEAGGNSRAGGNSQAGGNAHAGVVPQADTSMPAEESGALRVDPTVAKSAAVWVDPAESEIARADAPEAFAPKPHVDTDPQVDLESVSDRGSLVDSGHDSVNTTADNETTLEAQFDALQQVLDTLAVGSLSEELVGVEITSDVPDVTPSVPDGPLVETRIDPAESRTTPPQPIEPVAPHEPATPAQPRVPAEPESSPTTNTPFETAPPVEQSEFAIPREEPTAPAHATASANTIEPFRAAWEVDVFDVPNTVADLFFEGELFQQIAERMLDAVGSGLGNMLITSVNPGEGRSSVAIGMAMAAAAAGVNVALLDGDGHVTTLADSLRLELEQGWVDSIRSGVPITEVAVHAVEDGVTLIPISATDRTDAITTADEITQLMELLKNRFELVIVDGPAGVSPGLDKWIDRFDSAVIVCDRNRCDDDDIRLMSLRLQRAGIRGIGMVENRT